MSADSKYTTRLSQEEYDATSTIGVMVTHAGNSKMTFETDERKPGGTRMAEIVKKYLGPSSSETIAYIHSEASARAEVANCIARRIIRNATEEQSEDERRDHPLKPYVIIEEAGKNVFVDISELPDTE
jgi:hypothetical protein